MWWSIFRHSIDVKIMCRVPFSFLLARARQMLREYYVICLEEGVEPEHVDVGPKWLRVWLIEVRLAHRMPNR